jgi:hypothetical protein
LLHRHEAEPLSHALRSGAKSGISPRENHKLMN